MSPQARLAEVAAYCRSELERLGIDTDPRLVEGNVEQEGYKHPDREWFCAHIINLEHVIKKVALNGDIWTAIGLSISFGKMSMQMEVLGFDNQLRALDEKRSHAVQKNRQRAEAW